MTSDGEHLAPVTPLFGAKARAQGDSGGGTARRGAAPVRSSERWSDAQPSGEGWATDDEPGADEFGAGSVGAGELGAGDLGAGAAAAGARSGASGAGAGAARSGAAGARSAGAAATGARSAGAAAGGAGSAGAPAGGAREAGAPDHPSQRRGSARGTLRSVRPVDDEPAAVDPLPTYAAFAAKSDGRSVSFVGESEVADSSDAGSETLEPHETLEAATLRAENISLHALSRRGVSSQEMAKTLRSRDLPEEVVVAEVERLERVGLLDDAELAENLVRSKQERKGLGKSAISSELRQRGLAQEAIEAAIADIDDDEEQARADEWARKRAGQLRGLDQATAERRLNGFLMRRGYRSEVIRRAVERALPRGGSGGGVRFE